MKIQRLITSGIVSLSLLSTSAAPLAVMAQEEVEETTPIERSVVDVACMKTAIDSRENAIIAALDAYHVSFKGGPRIAT